MTHPNIRPAMLKDARSMAENIRQQDVLEIVALYGYNRSCTTLLENSIRDSRDAYAYVVDGRVLALAGCAYDFKRCGGVPWLICSDEFVDEHAKIILKFAPLMVARWLKRYGHLENIVHADNTVAQRWLKHLGFDIQVQYGATSYRFVKDQ
ncbi:hypothetical protein ASC76_19160 [Rhizobacter sp. Root404]|nr:hypothetical protein ASC76_19160 [Rhizobacter sp. Root404]